MEYEKLIHISDLHIRAGDSLVSRFDEYSKQFELFVQCIAKYDIETTLIVLTGDLFHDKSKIGPSAQILMQKLINGLAKHNVVAIRGNHDYRQDQPDEPDLIKPFFDEAPENLQYLDETGLYDFGNIEIGLVAVQDTLVRGAGSGINQTLPPFPKPTAKDDPVVKHRIALFHGSFGGAFLQNGSNVDERSNYPVNGWIEGYDILLFGDIHVQQIHRANPKGKKDKDMNSLYDFTSTEKKSSYVSGSYTYNESNAPWSYSGSLIQQNFGESIWGHGFSEWNLLEKSVTFYHLPNAFGFVVVVSKDDEPCVKVRMDGRIIHFPIQLITTFGWFPKRISLRLSSNIRHLFKKVQEIFASSGVTVLDTGFIEENANDIQALTAGNTQQSLENDLTCLNSVDIWIKYFMEDMKMEDGDWTQWIHHPHMLKTPEDIYSSSSMEKIKDRNVKFGKLVENFLHSKDIKAPVRRLRIHYIEFAWLLCFGENNWMDFDQFQKQICLINGNNGSGKSAFLEIICIALYGESFPSRYNKSFSASIINQQREKGKNSFTNICFSIDGKKYWLHRAFDVQQKNPKTIMQRNIYLMEHDTREAIKQTATHVNNWVEDHIGTFNHFLLTTIMSQSSDSDFFQMAPKEQKSIIDSLLQLNVCEEFRGILKESKTDHTYALSQLTSYEDGVKGGMVHFQSENSNIPLLQSRIEELEQTIKQYKQDKSELKQAFINIAEKDFQTPFDVYQAKLETLRIVPIEIDYTEVKTQRTSLRDRMAVLKTKPYVKQAHCVGKTDQPFHELETKLILAKNERLPYGKAKPYDEQQYKEWYSRYTKAKKAEKTEKTVKEIEYQLAPLQKAKKYYDDSYEITEDWMPISNDELLQMKQQDGIIHDKIQTIEQDIRNLQYEHAKLEASLPKSLKKRIQEYIQARTTLETEFASPNDAGQRIATAIAKQNTLVGIQKERAYTLKQLEDVGSVQYNPNCKECLQNPFKHKKEGLLQELQRIEKESSTIEKDIDTILLHKPLATVQSLYDCWQSLHSDQILRAIEDSKRITSLVQELEKKQSQLQASVEEREELGYETQEMFNTYHSLVDQITSLERERQGAVLEQEKEEWAQAKSLAVMDEHIAKLEQETSYAFSCEYNQTEQELAQRNSQIEQYEKTKQDMVLFEKYTAICEAYPFWKKYIVVEASLSRCEKEWSNCTAQFNQAVAFKKKQEDSIQMLERIQAFRKIVEERTKCITQLYSGFENYTNWLYPSKVGPVIEQAVNTILASIALPRPIRLKAEWDADHFQWIVIDGSSSPPYEKCSGSQRFFVSLALRFAFSRMGTSNMINAQMFLDEGFTACDAETMDRVPELLKNIVHNFDHLQTIFLVSHLDTLKSAANQSISILREDTNSKICFGEKRLMPKKV